MVRCSSCADSFNVWKASRSECGNPSRITRTRWAKRSHGFMILESAPSRTGRSPANGTSCRGMQLTKWLFIGMMINDNCFWSMHFKVEILYSIHVWCLKNHPVASSTASSRRKHPCRYWTSHWDLRSWSPSLTSSPWKILRSPCSVMWRDLGWPGFLVTWEMFKPISSKEWYL